MSAKNQKPPLPALATDYEANAKARARQAADAEAIINAGYAVVASAMEGEDLKKLHAVKSRLLRIAQRFA
jgi:hypothetical protein